jgi:malonyl CoA-acyl carrier protein transacylase
MRAVLFPGQGSQSRGMGAESFRRHRDMAERASDIAGWDIEELCVADPQNRLGLTQYTQPAVYVANALRWLDDERDGADFYLGHSLGEYDALLAAGAFDFETGLKLVLERSRLMAEAAEGTMLAVIGADAAFLRGALVDIGLTALDIANLNTRDQVVLSGPTADVERAREELGGLDVKTVPLNVSAPFHSRYMQPAADEFEVFLSGFDFAPLAAPVVANATARPYASATISETLCQQITAPVQWEESIAYLLRRDPDITFSEVGGTVLTRMVEQIRRAAPIERAASPAPKLPRAKLLCIAYAGGDARAYDGLAAALHDVEVVPLERPGRGRRSSEQFVTDADMAVDDLLSQIETHVEGRFALYGHSLGARLAHQVARRLDAQGRLTHLFVSGIAAPRFEPPEHDAWTLPSEELWQRLSAMGGTPAELLEHPDLMSYYEAILRADLQVLCRLRYDEEEEPLEVPITVMLGDDEPVALAEARRWQDETAHPLTLRMFAGDHFFIRRHWAEIAHLMQSRLGAVAA